MCLLQVNHSVDAPAIRAEDDNVWEWLAKPKKPLQPFKDPQATFHPKVTPPRPGTSSAARCEILYCHAQRPVCM